MPSALLLSSSFGVLPPTHHGVLFFHLRSFGFLPHTPHDVLFFHLRSDIMYLVLYDVPYQPELCQDIIYIPACFSLFFARYYYPFPPPISLIPAHRATVISASWYFHSSNFLPHPVTFIFYTVCSYMDFFSYFQLTSPGFTNPAGKFSAF